MNEHNSHRTLLKIAPLAAGLLVALGCERKMYDPNWATRPYPSHLHTIQTADMQVFRRDTKLQIVNSTAISYQNFDLWVNQRFVRHVDSLPAGGSITISLWDFHDEFGDRFNAGGFFRTVEPTPMRLVEIQLADDQPTLGLITIRSEEVVVKPEQGQ